MTATCSFNGGLLSEDMPWFLAGIVDSVLVTARLPCFTFVSAGSTGFMSATTVSAPSAGKVTSDSLVTLVAALD